MKKAKEKRLDAGEFGGSLHLSGFPCPKFDLAILKAPVDLKVSGCKDFRNSDLGYLKVSLLQSQALNRQLAFSLRKSGFSVGGRLPWSPG